MSETMPGGCACGRIRFTATVDSDDAYLCHCRMCQRATGSISIAFVGIEKAAVTWEREPDYYVSSPIARRPFCSVCGTSLGFEFPDSDKMDLTVASFDEPERFRPRHHYAAESMHEAWIDTSSLKRIRTEENANVVKRWMDAVGKLPD
ncbi:MAG: GFA family protein [Sphingomicrobium sp.]